MSGADKSRKYSIHIYPAGMIHTHTIHFTRFDMIEQILYILTEAVVLVVELIVFFILHRYSTHK